MNFYYYLTAEKANENPAPATNKKTGNLGGNKHGRHYSD
jgi:hypothetical protein